MAHTLYENFELENKFSSILDTALDMSQFMTVDRSLAEAPGMKKVINTYTASGSVQDLASGEGNTTEISVSFTPSTYEVATTQGRVIYTDEQEMQDPNIVDASLKYLAEEMANDLTAKAFTEFGKATLGVTYANAGNIKFDTVVDAIAKLNKEDEAGLFMLINPAMQAGLRKELKSDLVYNSDFVRAGYIGSVCGVPVIISKAVPAKTAYLASKNAVTCFIKKDSEIAQDRVENTRTNTVYGRKVTCVALTNAAEVVAITEAEVG